LKDYFNPVWVTPVACTSNQAILTSTISGIPEAWAAYGQGLIKLTTERFCNYCPIKI
jgi:hypothetical protein